jgi:hypothetical protein
MALAVDYRRAYPDRFIVLPACRVSGLLVVLFHLPGLVSRENDRERVVMACLPTFVHGDRVPLRGSTGQTR